MSLTGKVHTITINRTGPSGSPVITLVSFSAVDFIHESGAATATSVTKDDIAMTINDTYTVKIAYPNGSVPATSTTLANLVTAASSAVTTKYGAGELA
jgi:uncharacterized protein YijF (DUF1287 family)